MYTGQNIVKLAYGDKLIRPKSPKVKTLPIAHNITEAHSDFPLYIKPSSITGFGSLTLAEAQSLRFYADSAKTVELPREIVSADEIYVKASLATGTGNKLYLDWDGVSSDYAVSDTYGARNVWNSNILLRHNYVKGNSLDSTNKGYNGINSNISFGADGVIFSNASESRIGITNAGQFSFRNKSFSIVIMIKPNSRTSNRTETLIDFETSHWQGWLLRSDYHYSYLSGTQEQKLSNGLPSIGSWTLISFTSNGSNGKLYLNGGLDYTVPTLTYGNNSTSTYGIGCNYENATQSFDGTIKYVGIFNTELSSTRISTEYANQSNPATFFGTLT